MPEDTLRDVHTAVQTASKGEPDPLLAACGVQRAACPIRGGVRGLQGWHY